MALIAAGYIWALGAPGAARGDCDLREEDESLTTYRANGWEDCRPRAFSDCLAIRPASGWESGNSREVFLKSSPYSCVVASH